MQAVLILQYEKEKYMDNIKKALIKDQMTKRLAMVLIQDILVGKSLGGFVLIRGQSHQERNNILLMSSWYIQREL